MYEVIPGILEKNWEEIEKKIKIVKPFAKSLHIDILDGKFAPNITFLDPNPFFKYSTDIFLEVHMMVDEPIKYLDSFAKAGFKRFIGHIEKMNDQRTFVEKAKLLGEVGLAIDGLTKIEEIKVPLEDLDYILIMTIKAGFSGQKFMSETLDKVRLIRERTNIPIEVDGGINNTTIVQARDAGATRFATTSAIYKGPNPPFVQFQTLNNLIK